MIWPKFVYGTLFCFLLVCQSWAQDGAELSYLVVRLSSGQVLASKQATKLRVPASTLKLVTAAAALETLGDQHRYATSVWAQGSFAGGTLKGDLALKGDADPELTQKSLEFLAERLCTKGLEVVEGDLIVDAGPYAVPAYGYGWAWDDAGFPYQPEVSGLAIDGGVVRVEAGTKPDWLKVVTGRDPGVYLTPGVEGVEVVGPLPDEVAVPSSALYAGRLFRDKLEAKGISIRGVVRLGQARGHQLVTFASRPLASILRQALAVSDNLAMELVYRSSHRALPHRLAKEALCVVDGCGLSRANLISAKQLVDVLQSHPELAKLLPWGGEGTLKSRFLTGAASGQVRAKTGTLSQISGLAGYLYPGKPEACAFAILINGSLEPTAKRKAREDRLVEGWAKAFGLLDQDMRARSKMGLGVPTDIPIDF